MWWAHEKRPETPEMAVAIYLRVSTEEQRERQSILTQREFAERFCQLHDLQIFSWYADDGISGTVPLERRPEGSQILEDARAGRFNQLLIYRLDRLGRDTRLILNAVAELEKLGVRIKSMTEDFDTGTATGRLMLTMLSGFAAHERDTIRERSLAGTLRVAASGAWLGGIVPYGYRKVGEKRDARIVISEEEIAGAGMSEADVIREIFRLAAAERKSCRVIADHLNKLHIPCAYTRADRLVVRGKRKQKTSGLWRPGRIRNLITSKTYMGLHEYGKRSSSGRKLIVRPVPAIVTEEVWKKAQATLEANFLFGKRNARRQYLLRGLIKCELCGLTYIGVATNVSNGRGEFYYRCNGVPSRGMFGKIGQKCPSKSVRGDYLEKLVWSDVDTFLRNPGSVLEQLKAKFDAETKGAHKEEQKQQQIEALLAEKANERGRVVGLYRRGRLTDADLDQQINEIGQEEAALQAQLEDLKGKVKGSESVNANLTSAEALLGTLRERLDQGMSWEHKRQLIEILVARIRVDTAETCGIVQPKVTITYRFEKPNEIERVVPVDYISRPIRIPTAPETIGDHVRLQRLKLKLRQKEVAKQIGVDKTSINNWENNTKQPRVEHIPTIIEFLGYNPLQPGDNWAERLVRGRTTLGLSQKIFAVKLGVDPGTLARWERGEWEPRGRLAADAERLIAQTEIERVLKRAG
jgi:site-specific DNA recombinase